MKARRRLLPPVAGLLAALAFLTVATFARPGAAQTTAKATDGPIELDAYLPDGVTSFKGVLAFTQVGLGPGWGDSADFKDLAKRINSVVVQVKGANEFDDPSYPTRCSTGAFKHVLDALTTLGTMTKHPELTNAPIVGLGHSHGGDYWNYFNACYPDRMALIFCKSSGGVQYKAQALRTPMVWEIGTNDLNNMAGMFRGGMFSHRALGQQLALVLGPGETHEQLGAAPRKMAIDLIEVYFNQRVPADSDGSKGPVQLNDFDEASGKYWLGDNYTREVAAYNDSPDKTMLPRTSFLPTQAIADEWKMAGANLPTSVKIDTGVCTSCYKPLSTEPALEPLHVGGDATGTGGAGGNAGAAGDDGGAGASGDDAGTGGSAGSSSGDDAEAPADASDPGSSAGGSGGSGAGAAGAGGSGSAGSSGSTDTGSSKPPSKPTTSSGGSTHGGGCAVGGEGETSTFAAMALGLFAFVLIRRRRR